MHIDRRTFLQSSVLTGAALAAPRLSFAAPSSGSASANAIVVIFQRGGMDPLQAIPPWADSDYYRLRPTIGIPRPGQAGGALALDERFGLHPALAPIEPLFRSGKLAVVHATGLHHADRSHFECQDHIETALMGLDGHAHGTFSGWLNRQAHSAEPSSDFYAIGMGTVLQKSLYGSAPVVSMSNIASYSFASTSTRRHEVEDLLYGLSGADTLLGRNGRKALDSVDYLALANPGQFPVEGGASYPTTGFGNQLKEVAQLIKASVGLRLACVDIGGWDHHANIQTLLPPLLDELARGLAAFTADLGARMNNVTVITMTEFGRRAAENASGGTDHGCGSSMFLLGGGVKGGKVYTDWPGLRDSQLFNGDLYPTVDYRTVLVELLQKRMGNSSAADLFMGAPLNAALNCFHPATTTSDDCICLPVD